MNRTNHTESDRTRLSQLAQQADRGSGKKAAAALSDRLRNAQVRDGEDPGETFVRMQSTVTLSEIKTGETFIYRLVFPGESDISRGRLSILSPFGAALLGRREGETFGYESPGGTVHMHVEKIIHED